MCAVDSIGNLNSVIFKNDDNSNFDNYVSSSSSFTSPNHTSGAVSRPISKRGGGLSPSPQQRQRNLNKIVEENKHLLIA